MGVFLNLRQILVVRRRLVRQRPDLEVVVRLKARNRRLLTEEMPVVTVVHHRLFIIQVRRHRNDVVIRTELIQAKLSANFAIPMSKHKNVCSAF